MIVSDMIDGNGLAVIDPHGDLAEELLDFIPRARMKEVIYFNPADLEFPTGFNPLGKVHPDYHHLVSSGLISVFKKIWREFWGPRMEYILRNAILSLLEYQESTLLDLPRILVEKEFRSKVLKKVKNPQVRDFWLNEFEKYSAWLRAEAISPIQNKVGEFLCTPLVRNIFSQKESAINFRKIMDEGKILIVNLSKGKIGEDVCSLLGAMMVTRLELAALSRADTEEGKRKPFYLYVDEIHNFLTLSFASVLSEARKYGLSLILTHQYIEQLDEKIRSAIFGNVGTLISFRVGQEDAQVLAREFYPVFDETDLVNLSNYHIYLKLMIDGVTSKPFSAVTLPPPQYIKSCKEEIIEYSRQRYARSRAEVERESCLNREKEAPSSNNHLYD
jgi:type IV secretory pathway TraG/TraD family ATPase VirD4